MRTLRNCTDFYEDRRTLNVELVVALVLLFPWPWRARRTQTHAKKHTQNTQKQKGNQKQKPKRITKHTVTPGNPGVAMRLVMRLELQIGEIPLRFSGISRFARSKGKAPIKLRQIRRTLIQLPFFCPSRLEAPLNCSIVIKKRGMLDNPLFLNI